MLEDLSRDELLAVCIQLRSHLQVSENQRSKERSKSRKMKHQRDRILKLIETSLGIPSADDGHFDLNRFETQFLASIGKTALSSSATATTGESTSSIDIDEGIHDALLSSSSDSSFDSPYVPLSRIVEDIDRTSEEYRGYETTVNIGVSNEFGGVDRIKDEEEEGDDLVSVVGSVGDDYETFTANNNNNSNSIETNTNDVTKLQGSRLVVFGRYAEVDSDDDDEDDFEFGLALYD